MDECGGVLIRFPSEGSVSDKVVIRGPKEDVDKAKKQLLELAVERVSNSTIINNTITTCVLLVYFVIDPYFKPALTDFGNTWKIISYIIYSSQTILQIQ